MVGRDHGFGHVDDAHLTGLDEVVAQIRPILTGEHPEECEHGLAQGAVGVRRDARRVRYLLQIDGQGLLHPRIGGICRQTEQRDADDGEQVHEDEEKDAVIQQGGQGPDHDGRHELQLGEGPQQSEEPENTQEAPIAALGRPCRVRS